MRKEVNAKINSFLTQVKDDIQNNLSYRDSMLLQATRIGGKLPAYVSQADRKYQEATYYKTQLSQQENVDECALASMGKLWHGENFEGSKEQIESSDEETILDLFYFILKYAKSENPLKSALEANNNVCGDKQARKAFLELLFEV